MVAGEEVVCGVEGEAAGGGALEVAAGVFGSLDAFIAALLLLEVVNVGLEVVFCCCCSAGLIVGGVGIIFPS